MTNGERRIDLDAARAARLAKRGTPPVVVHNGTEYQMPAEMPAEAVTGFGMMQRGDLSGVDQAMQALLGDFYDQFRSGLSFEDMRELYEQLVEEYGFTVGESSASASSSSTTGEPSRPTSPVTTAST